MKTIKKAHPVKGGLLPYQRISDRGRERERRNRRKNLTRNYRILNAIAPRVGDLTQESGRPNVHHLSTFLFLPTDSTFEDVNRTFSHRLGIMDVSLQSSFNFFMTEPSLYVFNISTILNKNSSMSMTQTMKIKF